jgi:hypothetical protein
LLSGASARSAAPTTAGSRTASATAGLLLRSLAYNQGHSKKTQYTQNHHFRFH